MWYVEASSRISPSSGWRITDGSRVLRTPAGRAIIVPLEGLASRLAELANENTVANPGKNPGKKPGSEQKIRSFLAYQWVSTALDVMPRARAQFLTEELPEGCRCDTLGFWHTTPRALAEFQARHWRPWLDWSTRQFGVPLEVSFNVYPARQDPRYGAAMQAFWRRLDDLTLTLGVNVWRLSGSLVLASAVLCRRLSVQKALCLSRLEETFQHRQWGREAAAAHRRRLLHAEACQWQALWDVMPPLGLNSTEEPSEGRRLGVPQAREPL